MVNNKTALEVNIEIKPMSVNVAWQGRRFRTSEYKKYIEEMLYLLPERKTVEGKVGVFLNFYIKNPKQCDVDNFLKPMLDIIVKKGYIKDDRYIYFLQVQKLKSERNLIKIEIIKL